MGFASIFPITTRDLRAALGFYRDPLVARVPDPDGNLVLIGQRAAAADAA
jgi:hypothetical protein